MANEKKSNLLLYLIIFLGTFLVLQSFGGNKSNSNAALDTGDIGMQMMKNSYAEGKDIRVELKNNTDAVITLDSRCPEAPFNVYRFTTEGYEKVKNGDERDCSRVEDITLEPGKTKIVSLQNYSFTLFGEPGRYKLELDTEINGSGKTFTSPEFEIHKPSFITQTFRTVIYQPILNVLIAIIIYMPKHNLALSIIALTLLIRTILLVPSQRGMRAQKKMQAIQPKLEEIKKKYAHDQTRVAQETMALWKKHKVHPFSSCVPLLIQLPILIGLYYSVSSGLQPDQASYIYSFLPSFSLTEINPNLLGFNLLDRSIIVAPLIIGSMQFLQMQLMMHKQKKNKKHPEDKKSQPNEMEMANNIMKYVMPIMIAFLAAQMPAAVSLYWGTSTLYGIIQQLVINKESEKPLKDDDDGVKVRVINKNTHHS
ncbi:YidC/Oxa1 family membrane protein insertase [Patescibacteria group bacterium]|nr:YidC/Oxa1 family membrane protein insertase [Patescibacteria group bacterium]